MFLEKKMSDIMNERRKIMINDCKQEHWSERRSYLFISKSCHALLTSVDTYKMKMKWYNNDKKWWEWERWKSLLNC